MIAALDARLLYKIISLLSTSAAVLVVLLLCPPPYEIAGQLRATDKANCEQINQRIITLTVVDKSGAPVENLRSEDLSLFENKAPREIIKVERQKDQPLSVVILIDTSASQERSLARTKLAAQKFVEATLRSDKDTAAVVSFTGEATIEQDLTNDLTRLRAAINRVKFVAPPGFLTGGVVLGPPPSGDQRVLGTTAIWDAVWATVNDIKPTAGSRRIMVLLTDGEDTSSKTKMGAAIEYAAIHDVAIFCIGIADESYVDLKRGNLKRLSEETGGDVFFPKKVAELDAIFSQILKAIQSNYLLCYCAAGLRNANKPLRLEIKNSRPDVRLSYPHHVL